MFGGKKIEALKAEHSKNIDHLKINGVRHFITDMPSKQVGACAQRAMWRFSLGNCFLRTAKLVW
jgi:hypothetical protein